MANFSVNQVRQLYVVKDGYSATVSAASNVGTIGTVTKITTDGPDEIYFLYKGALDVLRSDIIQKGNIDYIKSYSAKTLRTPLKKIKVVVNSSVNSGAPVANKDYILNINFKNFFSSGDDSQYYKSVAVHVTAGMAADVKEFYKAMVSALNLAFSREDGATANSNPYLEFSAGTAGSEDGIYIKEKPQDWALGTMPQRRIMFDVFIDTIISGGDEVYWGTQTDQTISRTNVIKSTASASDYMKNGKAIADLEWFCLGERGDQYRGMGYPNTIHTEYLVNPNDEYHVLEIHYAFTDTGVNSYRTEKEITIVAPSGKTSALNSFIGALETATGLTIADVADPTT